MAMDSTCPTPPQNTQVTYSQPCLSPAVIIKKDIIGNKGRKPSSDEEKKIDKHQYKPVLVNKIVHKTKFVVITLLENSRIRLPD